MVLVVRGFIWFLLVFGASAAWSEGPSIPTAKDLRAEALEARSHGAALMIMFHSEYCAYCARMEDEFLKPMRVSGLYDEKVSIRKVALDADFALTGFDGRRTTGADLAKRYEVFVTPTLVFLDADGNQLTEKMVGLSTPDYFGGYLDAAIDSALARLRSNPTAVAGKVDRSCNPMC